MKPASQQPASMVRHSPQTQANVDEHTRLLSASPALKQGLSSISSWLQAFWKESNGRDCAYNETFEEPSESYERDDEIEKKWSLLKRVFAILLLDE